MQFEMSRERLQRYFSNITYIDDRFDHCFYHSGPVFSGENPSPEFDEEAGPPLSADSSPLTSITNTPDIGSDFTPASEDMQQSVPASASSCNPAQNTVQSDDIVGRNICCLLNALNQKEYSGIKLTPVLYSDAGVDQKQLATQISNSPLTLIDWELADKTHAFSILKDLLGNNKHLKVIVVYTASFQDALKELNEDEIFSKCPKVPTDEYDNLDCCICNQNSLLIVADKLKYNILKIQEVIVNLFISTCGILPVAVLDYMQKAQILSDELFSAFSMPIEGLYQIQMYFSELNDPAAAQTITALVQNRFSESCKIEPALINELFDFHKKRLADFVALDDSIAKDRLSKTLRTVSKIYVGDQRKFCTKLIRIDYAIFKECCETASAKSSNWVQFYSAFKKYFEVLKEALVNDAVNSLLGAVCKIDFPEDKQTVLDELKKVTTKRERSAISEKVDGFAQHFTPVLIQLLLSSEDMLHKGFEFVDNLKIKKEDNSNLGEYLAAGLGIKDSDREAFLMDKLHFGDVLVKEAEGKTEYLLCITPPCDAFRPAKTDLNIVYIRGYQRKHDAINTKQARSGVHSTVLPMSTGSQDSIVFVDWAFFDIVKFNLSTDDDYRLLSTFHRPYRLSEQYARQIANMFTSYFSRAGVDEVFFKSDADLRTLFLS